VAEAAEAPETQVVKMELPAGREAAQAVIMEQAAGGAVAREEAEHSQREVQQGQEAVARALPALPAVYPQAEPAAIMAAAAEAADTMAEEEDKATMTVPQEPAAVRRSETPRLQDQGRPQEIPVTKTMAGMQGKEVAPARLRTEQEATAIRGVSSLSGRRKNLLVPRQGQ